MLFKLSKKQILDPLKLKTAALWLKMTQWDTMSAESKHKIYILDSKVTKLTIKPSKIE